jgi:hypothetical protein
MRIPRLAEEEAKGEKHHPGEGIKNNNDKGYM